MAITPQCLSEGCTTVPEPCPPMAVLSRLSQNPHSNSKNGQLKNDLLKDKLLNNYETQLLEKDEIILLLKEKINRLQKNNKK